MTKEHKQWVLVAVLSITLYTVWPSSRKADLDTPSQSAASPETAGLDSEVKPAMHSASREHLVSSQSDEPSLRIETFRQRWSIDEILKMGPRERSPSQTLADGETNASHADNPQAIQAVYFTSSSTKSDASAIIGGQVVKRGQTLPGNRVVGEIHSHGIAIESAD